MITLNSPEVVQETTLRWKKESRIAFVPTMGCLHQGHLELVQTAKKFADKTVVSIFVNPLQFGPREDFEKYPRTAEADEALLQSAGVDLLFNPVAKDLYPDDFQSRVTVHELGQPLCGASRPGHFEGVATICLKLFNIVQPHFAVFGMKDFQQLRIIQQMTADLNLPISIIPEPTVREADGLALSSRNKYLSEKEREFAAKIPEAGAAAVRYRSRFPTAMVGDVVESVQTVLRSAPVDIEYVSIASEKDLKVQGPSISLDSVVSPRLFIAVKIGNTRLIDNWSLNESSHEKTS